MRLLNKEIDSRLEIALDKSINSDDVLGIMKYGTHNDYPQIMEKLIFSSPTAKACMSIYSKFLSGDGFESDIGNIKIGVDNKGKPITVNRMLRQVCDSLGTFHGAYIHCNQNLNREVGNTSLIPFKHCRLTKQDDKGYCAKIAVHSNWTKEKDLRKFNKNQVTYFNHFNLIPEVFNSQVSEEGWKGQVYTIYLDDNYLYPLSPFDVVYLDMDTEYQIQLYKNGEIRNGFTDKIVMNIVPPKDENERDETIKKIKSWAGPRGEKIIIFESEFDDNGELSDKGSFKTAEIKTTINDKLFENWEKSIANNIRKSIKGLPAVLIDYEMGTLGAASGEMIIQAVAYYNAITRPLREQVSEVFKDIYSNHSDSVLKSNQNWKLKDFKLLDQVTGQGVPYVKPIT